MIDIKLFTYKIDHYDAWNYVIIGPISILASFSFIILNIYFKQARKFPGNLLIIISLAEFVLGIHWFFSGVYSKYIYGTEVQRDDYFCTWNKHVAFVAGTTETLFQFAFIIAIINQFRNTMKEDKYKFLYIVLPITGILAFWYKNRSQLGMNLYGTCSIDKANNSVTTFVVFIVFYLGLIVYSFMVLWNFQKLSQTRITIRDDFYRFYYQYMGLTFIFYTVIGFTFVIDNIIL